MARHVPGGIANSMLHQLARGIVVVKIGPCAQDRIRPCCFRSDLQPLIRSLVPGRIGPTPRQLFPTRTAWRHSEPSTRGIYRVLIGSKTRATLQKDSNQNVKCRKLRLCPRESATPTEDSAVV